MRKRCWFLFLMLSLASCNFSKKSSPFRGYVSDNGLVYYKYMDFGVKENRISPGETMEVFITYSRMNDSVFWDSRGLWYPFTIILPYDSLAKSNSYRKVLLKCNEGDSVSFILKKDLLPIGRFGYTKSGADSLVKVNVRVAGIFNADQLKVERHRYDLLGKDKEMKEEYELTRYLSINKVPDSDKKGDIYLIPITEGGGPEVAPGCRVSISYRGYFMNHRTFDSIPVNDPMDFIIGDSGQVISGLEKGIKKMREGEVAKIIIPSHSAFGEKGSSTGIVPPYATLVYEVTMLKVEQTLKNN